MDPQRFDSLAKRMGSRLSRRGALRAGAGAALGAFALNKALPSLAQDPDTTVKDRFISIRTYPYTGDIAAAEAGLKALVALMEQQPGFISIDFVDGDDEIHIVASYLDKTTAVAAAKVEDAWIAENAQEILAGKPEINSGPVFLRSELQTGCGCTTGVDDACGSSRLTCCPTSGTPGSEGVCLTTATTCPAVDAVTPTATSVPAQPTAVPTDVPPTEIPACTGSGCDCTGGVEGACDSGLVCCAGTPGGAGTCMTEAECNPPCTGDGCACTGGVEGACDSGLVCCADTPGGSGVCATESACNPSCTGEGCGCVGGVDGGCDDGLVCCASAPGAYGSCLTEAVCYPTCTQEGCTCDQGTEGACDEGLCCIGDAAPGGRGTCSSNCDEA